MRCFIPPPVPSQDASSRRSPGRQGYSLVELLIVLFIIGILSMVGVTMIGSRPASSVRALLDDLEGTLVAAQKRSVATGMDVTLATQGSWTSTDPFLLAYGDATTQAGVAIADATVLANGLTAPESFRYQATSRDHLNAGIVVKGSGWWSVAALGNTALSTVAPFSDSTSSFASLVSDPATDTANLANRGTVKVSGYNKRFILPFYIAVVGIRNGEPIAGGPMGLVVVLNNGATVYKYYNAGVGNGNNAWRKL